MPFKAPPPFFFFFKSDFWDLIIGGLCLEIESFERRNLRFAKGPDTNHSWKYCSFWKIFARLFVLLRKVSEYFQKIRNFGEKVLLVKRQYHTSINGGSGDTVYAYFPHFC